MQMPSGPMGAQQGGMHFQDQHGSVAHAVLCQPLICACRSKPRGCAVATCGMRVSPLVCSTLTTSSATSAIPTLARRLVHAHGGVTVLRQTWSRCGWLGCEAQSLKVQVLAGSVPFRYSDDMLHTSLNCRASVHCTMKHAIAIDWHAPRWSYSQ